MKEWKMYEVPEILQILGLLIIAITLTAWLIHDIVYARDESKLFYIIFVVIHLLGF